MVLDALRGYVQLASGLTEVSRARAVTEAKALLAQRGALEQLFTDQAKGLADDVGRQVQTLADDLLATSKANREVLLALVRAESERAAGSLGFATAEELAALRRRVERIDAKITPSSPSATKKSAAKKSPTKTAKKSTAKKSTAKKPATTSATRAPAVPAPERKASS